MTTNLTPFPFDPTAYFRAGQAECASRLTTTPQQAGLLGPLHRIACKNEWMEAMLDEGLNNPIAHRDIAAIATAALASPPPTIDEVRAALLSPDPMPPRMQMAWCVLDGWFAGA